MKSILSFCTLPLLMALFMLGCFQESSNPVSPDDPLLAQGDVSYGNPDSDGDGIRDKQDPCPNDPTNSCDPGEPPPGDPPPGDPGGAVVELSDGYTTDEAQPVEYKETGRTAEAHGGEGIDFQVNLTTLFDADSCESTAANPEALWTEAVEAFGSANPKIFYVGVNKKAEGQANAEHRTSGRFFIVESGTKFMWEFKAGTPGDLLPGLGTRNAIGTFADNGATKTFDITSGAIRFRKANCGPDDGGAGCSPSGGDVAVACPNTDTFTAIVTL